MQKKMWKKEDGNMILEAAIIAPVFMLFIFFLWILIMVSAAQMNLDRATKDAVEDACKKGYVIGYAGSTGEKVKTALLKKVEEVADENVAEKINNDRVYSFLKDTVKGVSNAMELNNISYELAYGQGGIVFGEKQLKSAIEKDLTESMSEKWAQNVVVEYTEQSADFVSIKVTCEVPINIPLVKDYKMKLSSKAKSYIWKMKY